MSNNPLVSVYIPSKNYGRFLNKSIDSVINQLYTNWELFIVDEASDDDTILISNGYVSKFPKKIRLISNKTSIGLQKLSNKILNISNGKYMMRLDADDWLDESALLLMVSKLESREDLGLVYGNYFYTDEEGNILGMESRAIFGKEDISGDIPPHGACTLFRTRSLKSVGGYSEQVNAQDGWDLWFKLYNKIGVANVVAPVFYYRQHGSSLSRNQNRLLAARSKIFEEIAEKLEGNYKPTCVAVIPVKESYPHFEGVPYKDVNGQSLLEISISNSFKSKKIKMVVVSSESQQVLDYSKRLEIEGKVPKHLRLLRKKTKNSRNIPINDFMFSAGELYFENNNEYPDIILFLSMHSINRNSQHIDKAINVLRINESDSVVSVTEQRDPMFKHGQKGLELINPGRFQKLSYDKEKLYKFNGVLIATWWEILKSKSNSLFGERISYIEMSNEDSIQIKSESILKSINKD